MRSVEQCRDEGPHEKEPAENEDDQVLGLGVDGDVFAYEGAGPVVEGHTGTDAGTLESDLSAVSECPVDVVVGGDEGGILFAFPGIDDGLGIDEILVSRRGPVFADDPVFRDFPASDIAGHSLRFRDCLVAALAA